VWLALFNRGQQTKARFRLALIHADQSRGCDDLRTEGRRRVQSGRGEGEISLPGSGKRAPVS
jgi:hypothetical protein